MNFAEYLINDFQGDTKIKSIKFFRSSGAYGYIAWLTIISFYLKKDSLTIEHLVNALESYASRRTILDFLNKGFDGGFLEKKNSSKHKRKVFIEPSKITLLEFQEWSVTFTSKIKPL